MFCEPCRSQLHAHRPYNHADRLQVALACHVPKALAEEKELGVKEWFETVTKAMEGVVEIKEESEEVIIAICHASKEKELFALKMRDAGSSAGYQMLLKKGLIPQDGAQILQYERSSDICAPWCRSLGASGCKYQCTMRLSCMRVGGLHSSIGANPTTCSGCVQTAMMTSSQIRRRWGLTRGRVRAQAIGGYMVACAPLRHLATTHRLSLIHI